MPDGWESVRGARRIAATVVCVTVALAFLLPGLGLVDLVTPFHLHEGGEVLDVGYGTLAGIVVPVAFLSQVRRRRPPIAGLQLALAAALAYLLAGVLGGDPTFYVYAAVLATATALVLALQPRPARILARGRALLAPALLALAAVGPLVAYALEMAENQRDNLPPVDAHAELGAWAALTAAALTVAFAALLAAAGTEGFVVPGLAAAAAAAAWGAVTLVYPDHAGAKGTGWGLAAVLWALAFAAAVAWSARTAARRR